MEIPARDGFSPTDLAYAAGIVDGEGSISAYLKLKNQDGGPGNLLRINVTVVNTDFDLTRWLKEMFGGDWGVRRNETRNPSWKPISYWTLWGNRAGDFLEQVYPYLRVKRDQADVAIALAYLLTPRGGEGRHRGVPEDNRQSRELLVEELRRLNDNRRRRARAEREEVS